MNINFNFSRIVNLGVGLLGHVVKNKFFYKVGFITGLLQCNIPNRKKLKTSGLFITVLLSLGAVLSPLKASLYFCQHSLAFQWECDVSCLSR